MKIIVDMMGGDNAPKEILLGAPLWPCWKARHRP